MVEKQKDSAQKESKMEVFLGIIVAWIIAEIGSALFHHFEDRYGNPDWEDSESTFKRIVFQAVIGPNVIHHKQPAAMLKGNYWYRNRETIIASVILAGISFFFWPTAWPVYCGFLLMSQSNEIHGWAHQKCNRFIAFFQRIGLLQSPKHHKIHHTVPYNTNYCVMTNLLNPILNAIYFWRVVEFFYWLIFGLKPLKVREIY